MVKEESRQILRLAGAVTIRHARELAAELAEELEDGTPLAVDTAALQDVDTCILQLLDSLRKTVPAISFPDPSDAFLAALDRCGLRRELSMAREES
jgi:anti-anti-sigma regulatory factor